jgi:hypothetical protein
MAPVDPRAGGPFRGGAQGREGASIRPAVDVHTPFGRLALAHVLSLAGDALVAMALAGSLFFDVDPSGARWRIALYLAFTMAPFAVVGPLIGPAMDRARGGHRTMLVASAVGRGVVALLMVSAVATDSLLLFPEAFVMLVLAKTYQVARAAIVPTVVHGDAQLVSANSKLQLLSGLAGVSAAIPGGLLLLVGPGAVMVLAAAVFAAAALAGLRVPATRVADAPAGPEERAELRSAAVLTAASAMGSLRAVVGFVTFLLAFALRGEDGPPPTGTAVGRLGGILGTGGETTSGELVAPIGPPSWHFGVVVVLSVAGGLLGAALAPVVRRRVREELVLLSATGIAVAAGITGALLGGLAGQSVLALGVAAAASSGKQAFDAVVQRDAPDANRGRSFARFESRFQVAWVAGAFVPVVVAIPTALGAVMVAALAGAAGLLFTAGMRAVDRGEVPPRLPTAKEVGRVVADRSRSRRWRREPAGGDPDGTDPDGTDPDGTDPDGTDPDGTDPGDQGPSGRSG